MFRRKRILGSVAMMVALLTTLVLSANTSSVDYITEDQKETIKAEELTYKTVSMPEIDIEDLEKAIEKELEEAEEEEEIPEYFEYTVQPGDSFWSIAKEVYGDGKYYLDVAAYNNLDISNVIYSGMVLKIENKELTMSAEAVSYSAPPEEEVEEETTAVYTYGESSFNGDLGMTEALSLVKDGSHLDTSNMTYMGNWRVTGYDPHCSHCCGKTNGVTASGNQAEFGTSVGVNNLPLGTMIYVDGYGIFRVDDRGGMSSNHVDIAAPSHDVCYQLTGYADVYVISYPD